MLEFKSVSKTYPDGTQAVSDLNLIIPSDGITVLVGPSGCGKTTTLRMINRMIEPSAGEIRWDGQPLRSLKKTTLRRQMGYVIQNGGLFPHRTVLENIATVPELLGWDADKTLLRSRELLEQVGLEIKLGHRFPAQLSGGQQQRVGVARALAADPVLLLMDEPFSAVDPAMRTELQQLVRDLQRELNKTIVMITHDMDEAISMGDRVAVLRQGGVLAQFGTPEEILDDPADDFVADFVGRDRGYRSLVFAEVPQPTLGRVRTVRNAAQAYAGSADRSQPVLVVDAGAIPQGWADADRPGRLLELGATFTHPGAPLREIVEAALTSPVGRAVAVGENGRYAGVLTSAEVMDQVQGYRADVAGEQLNRQLEAERIEAQRLEAQRIEAERIETERLAAERIARAEAEQSGSQQAGPDKRAARRAAKATKAAQAAEAGEVAKAAKAAKEAERAGKAARRTTANDEQSGSGDGLGLDSTQL